jgi:hypothetical protein
MTNNTNRAPRLLREFCCAFNSRLGTPLVSSKTDGCTPSGLQPTSRATPYPIWSLGIGFGGWGMGVRTSWV